MHSLAAVPDVGVSQHPASETASPLANNFYKSQPARRLYFKRLGHRTTCKKRVGIKGFYYSSRSCGQKQSRGQADGCRPTNRSRRLATTAVFETVCASGVGFGLKICLPARKRLNSSVDFFKEEANKYNTQYQKMIRRLLDEYAAHQS